MRSLRLALVLFFVVAAGLNAGTFTVTNTNQNGPGSLYQALYDVIGSTSPTNTINFAIGSGPVTIRPNFQYPWPTKPVVIDGTTQPGYAGTPIVELDGSGCYASGLRGCVGLGLAGGNSTIKGLVINNYSNHDNVQGLGAAAAITLASSNNTVVNCFIGTDITGSSIRKNDVGVRIGVDANNNVIGTGSGSWATRNLISGNGSGIESDWGTNRSTSGTIIRGNWFGTNSNGQPGLYNYWGLYLAALANGTVGGTNAGEGNLILDKAASVGSSNIKWQGNKFGVNGTIINAGLSLGYGSGNVVGGTVPGAGNTFLNIQEYGIYIQDTPNNTVQGNTFTNCGYAIHVAHINADGNADNNTIGGTQDGAGNTIRNTTNTARAALIVYGAVGTKILRNSFSNDANIAIDLNEDGVTANDAGDGDGGANNSQNFPVIAVATSGNGTTTIAGTLNSQPFNSYRIELFSNAACDPSGYGEGETYLGALNVLTDAGGNASFLTTLNTVIPIGRAITATATDTAGNTSEFSHCATVTAGGVLAFASSSTSVSEGDGNASITVNRLSGSSGTVGVNFATANGTAKSGSDYTATAGTLTFADGETSKTISVPILQDLIYEGNETFTVTLSGPSGGVLLAPPGTNNVTIVDDDVPSRATIADVRVTEGNSGTTNAVFTVTLNPAPAAPASLQWTTNPGTAGANDFVAGSGTLNFAAGETQKTITVLVNGDTLYEPDETFTVVLSNPSNMIIDRSTAIGTIANDDPQPIVTADDVSVTEGNGGTTNVTIKLTANTPFIGTVNFATADGSAFGASDYVPASGSLVFNNETEKQITVAVNGDTMPETDETFRVHLSGDGIVFPHPDVVVTILNDDQGLIPSNMTLGTGQSGTFTVDVGNPVAATQTLAISKSDACIKVPATVDINAAKHSAPIVVTALTAPCNARVDVKLPPALGGGTLSGGVHTYQTIDLQFDPPSPQLYVGQSINVTVKAVPFVEPMTMSLTASGFTVVVSPTVEVPDANGGSFTMRAIRSGPIYVEVTLPAQFGGTKVPLTGMVSDAPPTVTIFDVTPKSGAQTGGTPVAINGENFTPDCTISFDGAAATSVSFENASLIKAATPAHKPGAADVTATCSGGTATLKNGFIYTGGTPDITSVTPASGSTAGGTTVRIGGRDLVSDCWVEFGGELAHNVQVLSATEMIATTPAHAAGAVTVKLRCNGGGTGGALPNGFTYVTLSEPSAVVTGVDPLSAVPGAQVTVTGTHFGTRDVVTFDTAQAQVLSTTPDAHVVVVPTLPPGKVSVAVSGSTTGPIFTVLDPVTPKVTKLSPLVLPPNAELTIEGSGFRPPYAFTIGGVAARLISESYTRVVVRVPATPSGQQEVAIVNAGNVVAIGGHVTVSPAGIIVYGASPQCIPMAGAATISISGSGFGDGATVTIGGVAAARTTVVDATHIDVVTPPLPSGFATIIVTNPSGDNGTATNAVRAYSPLDPDGCLVPGRPRAVRH